MIKAFRMSVLSGAVATIALTSHPLAAQPFSPGDSAAAVAAVGKFHEALAAGDSLTAIGMLSATVQILESGGIEDLAHYREHHLPADIAYAKSAPTRRTVNQVVVRGDAAWIVSTSVTSGEVSGRPVNSQGVELVVLVRSPGGWKISAVHWSSKRRT